MLITQPGAARPPARLCQSSRDRPHRLFPVADQKEVEELGQRFGIRGAGASAGDQGVALAALAGVEGDPCEVEQIEDVARQ